MITEQEWLELRKQGIGGSECSSILGLNPYMSNLALWKIKTNRKEETDISDKPYVKYGKENEHIIRNRFIEQYCNKYDLYHEDYDVWFSTKHDFLFASLDGELTNIETGEKGILEIKTCMLNKYNRNKWDGNKLPPNYYCQILHYLMVTGFSYALVYVQFRDYENNVIGYKLYNRIDAKDKQKDIDNLRKAEIYFWNYNVLQDIKPKTIHQLGNANSKDEQKDIDNSDEAEIYFWNIEPNNINQLKKAG